MRLLKNISALLAAPVLTLVVFACGHSETREAAREPAATIAMGGESQETDESELPYGEADLQRIPPSAQYEKLESLGDVFFDWPVDEARLTRGFIPERRKRKRPHLGIDLAGPRGTPIFSAQAGTVIYAGKAFRGYGKMILVENRNGWASLYAHLNKINIREGDAVTKGQKIAEMGNTGRSTGNHLHFEIRRDRRPVDPMAYLPGVEGSASRALNPDLNILPALANLFALHPSARSDSWPEQRVAHVGNFSNSWDEEVSP